MSFNNLLLLRLLISLRFTTSQREVTFYTCIFHETFNIFEFCNDLLRQKILTPFYHKTFNLHEFCNDPHREKLLTPIHYQTFDILEFWDDPLRQDVQGITVKYKHHHVYPVLHRGLFDKAWSFCWCFFYRVKLKPDWLNLLLVLWGNILLRREITLKFNMHNIIRYIQD